MKLFRHTSLVALLIAALVACSGASGGPRETAAHRPALRQVPGAPAPEALTAPLVRPADLGPTWRYRTTPAVETKPEPTPATNAATGEIRRSQEILWAAHWNGAMWQDDADVLEFAVRFATPADALRFIRQAAHPVAVARHQVWVLANHGSGAPLGAAFDDGTTVLQLIIGRSASAASSTLSMNDILRVAVRRAFATFTER